MRIEVMDNRSEVLKRILAFVVGSSFIEILIIQSTTPTSYSVLILLILINVILSSSELIY